MSDHDKTTDAEQVYAAGYAALVGQVSMLVGRVQDLVRERDGLRRELDGLRSATTTPSTRGRTR